MITINKKLFGDIKLEQYLQETQQYIDSLKKELLKKILNSPVNTTTQETLLN